MNQGTQEKSSCLLIFAHPDDEQSCTSIISMLTSRGFGINIVFLTHGGSNRESEGRASIGIITDNELDSKRVEFCEWPDTKLQTVVPEMAEFVSKRVQELEPQLIVTHDPNDMHSDHRATYSAVEIATRYLPISLLTFGGPSTRTQDFEANLFLPLPSETMLKKLDAAHVHQTKRHRPYLQTPYLTGIATGWKNQHAFLSTRRERFYEAFHIERIEAPVKALAILLTEQCVSRVPEVVHTQDEGPSA